jgi:hypothetical protein
MITRITYYLFDSLPLEEADAVSDPPPQKKTRILNKAGSNVDPRK